MLYLPWPDQKAIKDRNPPPNWDYWENAKVECNKRVIINISEISIYLWRIVGQKDYRDCGQELGVGYGPDSPSYEGLSR